MRVHYFQHVPFESPGYIQQWAEANRCSQSFTRFYEKYSLPDIAQIDWLVVMGGPMGVYDTETYSWLEAEKKFIRQCIDTGKTVIGICLGSQLIAAALSAAVYPNDQKEIGWFPVQLTEAGKSSYLFGDFPKAFMVLHWHGDTFDLPEGAILLAKSQACKNQAFLYGNNVLGLQFHFESTGDTLPLIIENCRHELAPGPYVQQEQELKEGSSAITTTNAMLAVILNRLAGFNKV